MVKCFPGMRPFRSCFSAPTAVKRAAVSEAQILPPNANESPDVALHPAADAHRAGRLAITFSGGGFLLPYFIGVADALIQLGVLRIGAATPNPNSAGTCEQNPNLAATPGQNSNPSPSPTITLSPTPLAGASAGSLMAVSLACGLTPARILDSFLDSVQDCRTHGSYRRLEEVLYRQLESSLPADAVERCTGVATVSVTQLFPRPRTRRMSSWATREELIRALMASCHIPNYFNGQMTSLFRGKHTVDGGVTALMPEPTTPHDFLLKVCCFPREQLARLPVFNRRRALHQLGLGITPDAFGPWPYSFRYMLAAALHPRSYRFIRLLLEAGTLDAVRWASSSGIVGPQELAVFKPLPLPMVLQEQPYLQPPDAGPGKGAGMEATWTPASSTGSDQLHAAAAVALAAGMAAAVGNGPGCSDRIEEVPEQQRGEADVLEKQGSESEDADMVMPPPAAAMSPCEDTAVPLAAVGIAPPAAAVVATG